MIVFVRHRGSSVLVRHRGSSVLVRHRGSSVLVNQMKLKFYSNLKYVRKFNFRVCALVKRYLSYHHPLPLVDLTSAQFVPLITEGSTCLDIEFESCTFINFYHLLIAHLGSEFAFLPGFEKDWRE